MYIFSLTQRQRAILTHKFSFSYYLFSDYAQARCQTTLTTARLFIVYVHAYCIFALRMSWKKKTENSWALVNWTRSINDHNIYPVYSICKQNFSSEHKPLIRWVIYTLQMFGIKITDNTYSRRYATVVHNRMVNKYWFNLAKWDGTLRHLISVNARLYRKRTV